MNVEEVRREAEALRSKALVEDLKARRVRPSRKAKALEKDPQEEDVAIPSSESHVAFFASALSSLSTVAFDLLKDTEKLQSMTEQKSSHFEGMETGLRSFQKTIVFNNIQLSVLALIQRREYVGVDKLTEELRHACSLLLDQHLTCLALFALSCAHFSFAADLTRAIIKRRGAAAGAGLWVMRALSFAGIGSAYLAGLHVRSAMRAPDPLPGLSQVSALLAREEHCEATRTRSAATEVRRCLYFLRGEHDLPGEFLLDNPALGEARVEDFLCLLSPHTEDAVAATTDTSADRSSLLGEVEARLGPVPGAVLHKGLQSARARLMANSFLTKLRALQQPTGGTCDSAGLTAQLTYEAARRLFYEGQVLFEERLLASAERKFLAAASLVTELVAAGLTTRLGQEMRADADEVACYLSALAAACEHNVQCARLQRNAPRTLMPDPTDALLGLRLARLLQSSDPERALALTTAVPDAGPAGSWAGGLRVEALRCLSQHFAVGLALPALSADRADASHLAALDVDEAAATARLEYWLETARAGDGEAERRLRALGKDVVAAGATPAQAMAALAQRLRHAMRRRGGLVGEC